MTQKIAIVTGAGTGVGRAVTLALMREGYAVVLAGRRQEMLDAVAKEGAQTPGAALTVQTDVADPASIKALFCQATKATYGRVDLLFNNAGIGTPGHFDRGHAVRQMAGRGRHQSPPAVFLCTQEAIKIMKAQDPRGGRIINNGSISAHTPRPGAAAYTATKHAVTGLTKQTSLDCRPYNICCGQIDIGNAATPLTDRMVQGDGVPQPDGRKMIEPRMAADDVGRAVVCMANLPLDTNVLFMTVMANLMPFVGRG